jgi:hypothetical protein
MAAMRAACAAAALVPRVVPNSAVVFAGEAVVSWK